VILPAIPTAISPREARFLRDSCAGKAVVEYGALLGFSTVILARAAGQLISIDRHEGYTGRTLAPFLSNLERHGVLSRVSVLESDAVAWAHLRRDVAFVDLTGAFELTRTILERLGSPLALVHDCGRPGCDVDLAIHRAGWTPVDQVDTLVLCARH
jgi:tRNA A58 N-methylase Trm61